jgi:hypothetical protein
MPKKSIKGVFAATPMNHISECTQKHQIVLHMNPVGYWPADEGSGEVLNDVSGNGNHARLHNVEWDGNLLYFRGLFQWAEIPSSAKYTGRKFSYGGWVFLRTKVLGSYDPEAVRGAGMTLLGNGYHTSSYNLVSLNQEEVLFCKSTWRVGGGASEGASIRIRREERIDILSDGKDDVLGTEKYTGQVAIGQWQHILYTYESPAQITGGKEWESLQDTDIFYNAGKAKLYVNGKLVESSERVGYTPRTAPFYIGSDAEWWLQAVTPGSLDGSVRDIVIFDRVVSPEEVELLYHETLPEASPKIFNKNTLLLDDKAIDGKNVSNLSQEHSWELLRQLGSVDIVVLEEFTPWLKTQRDAMAVKLLLKLGEVEIVKQCLPDYMQTFQNKNLSETERADALLALAECKGLVTDDSLGLIAAELRTLRPQMLKVEDFYRNTLIHAVSELDPDNELLEQVIVKLQGAFFSQGDELRDSRPEIMNLRAYTSSVTYQGDIYRCGNGVAFDGVEPVPAEEFEQIAKEIEDSYPNVRRWAEGKSLARVTINKSDSQGNIEKFFPLGRKFIFDKNDAKLRGWSIAFDKQGYLHLTGGMHNAPVSENFMPGSWESWGMSRRFKSDKYPSILYWISKKPSDSNSFDFVGHRDNRCNIPLALGMNYMNFVQDRNNELYLYGRIHVQGLQSWGLYRYDTANKTWTAIGGFAPDVKKSFPVWSDRFIAMAADWLALAAIRWKNNHPKNRVLAWARQPHFYNFIRGWAIRWDQHNRMHIQIPLFALDKNNRNTNMQLYAYSDDGGRTFCGVDGELLALPLTANPGQGNADLCTVNNLKRWNLWVSLLEKSGYEMSLTKFE